MKKSQVLNFPKFRLEKIEKEFREHAKQLEYFLNGGGGMDNIHMQNTLRALSESYALYCGYRGAVNDVEEILKPKKR
jgi:hypothetical protein